VEVLGLPPAVEVITPALTFSTTVACIIKNGLVPAFVDVKEGTYNIDPDGIEGMDHRKDQADVHPNLIGNVVDWARVGSIARKHNLLVIEDSADTLGASLNGRSRAISRTSASPAFTVRTSSTAPETAASCASRTMSTPVGQTSAVLGAQLILVHRIRKD